MNLLLDSHTFVWWRDNPKKLSSTAYTAISDQTNNVYISLAALWELQIKIVLKKLTLNGKLEQMIVEERKNNGFQLSIPVRL